MSIASRIAEDVCHLVVNSWLHMRLCDGLTEKSKSQTVLVNQRHEFDDSQFTHLSPQALTALQRVPLCASMLVNGSRRLAETRRVL